MNCLGVSTVAGPAHCAGCVRVSAEEKPMDTPMTPEELRDAILEEIWTALGTEEGYNAKATIAALIAQRDALVVAEQNRLLVMAQAELQEHRRQIMFIAEQRGALEEENARLKAEYEAYRASPDVHSTMAYQKQNTCKNRDATGTCQHTFEWGTRPDGVRYCSEIEPHP